jgi:hypothetical protein
MERAAELVRVGAAPHEAFVHLVSDNGNADEAVLAVCHVLGISLDEAQRRVRQHAPQRLLDELKPDEDATSAAGEVLASVGCFDVPHQPDEGERPILAALNSAASARLSWPSGVWAGCCRLRDTGRYPELFTRLVEHGDRDVPDPAAYWSALATAADLLGDRPQARYQEAVQVTRQRNSTS